MNKKIIIAFGISALFLLLCANSVIAQNEINTEKSDFEDKELEPKSLTGDDFRIKIRGKKITFSIKYPKRFEQSSFSAIIETTITKKSELLYNRVDRHEKFASGFSYNDIHSDHFRFGLCRVNVKVIGTNDDEGLYKELTVTGFVFVSVVIAFGDTF